MRTPSLNAIVEWATDSEWKLDKINDELWSLVKLPPQTSPSSSILDCFVSADEVRQVWLSVTETSPMECNRVIEQIAFIMKMPPSEISRNVSAHTVKSMDDVKKAWAMIQGIKTKKKSSLMDADKARQEHFAKMEEYENALYDAGERLEAAEGDLLEAVIEDLDLEEFKLAYRKAKKDFELAYQIERSGRLDLKHKHRYPRRHDPQSPV